MEPPTLIFIKHNGDEEPEEGKDFLHNTVSGDET
jgi:hypothetical protein